MGQPALLAPSFISNRTVISDASVRMTSNSYNWRAPPVSYSPVQQPELLLPLVGLISVLRAKAVMNQAVLAVEPPPLSTINRRLAAIAFADVAGFSRLMALDDVETVRRWRSLRADIMEPHMAR